MFRGNLCKFSLVAVLVLLCSAEVAWAQPGRGGRGGGFFGGNSALGLLTNEKVQAELEIVGDQAERLQQLQQEQREMIQEMFSGMRDRFREMDETERESAMREIREKMTAKNEELDKEANDVLLAHQVDRLKQLMVQAEGRRGGGITGGQMSETLVEELGITEEQLAAMKDKAEKVSADLAEKMAKLRSQAEDEILSVLDAGQQAKYRELVGTPFEFDRGGRGGRGGDRGGRGGDRGGRGGDTQRPSADPQGD